MDFRDVVGMSRSKITEFLAGVIPGYGGYTEKETRREADKLLRVHLADRLEEQKKRLQSIRDALVDDGNIMLLDDIDRNDLIMENLVDSLRYTSYGYAGFFDAVTVKEDALDRIYEFDASLMVDIDGVTAKIEELKAGYGGDDLKAKISELKDTLKEFEFKLDKRKSVISEVA